MTMILIRRRRVFGDGSSSGDISGMASAAGIPLAAGDVLVYATEGATTPLQRVAVNGSGLFTQSGLTNGTTVWLEYHPPFSYSRGSSEPARRNAVVGGSPTAFTAQRCLAFDDFQGFSNTAAMKDSATGWWRRNNTNIVVNAGISGVSLDKNAWADGSDAMRYDWIGAPSSGCFDNQYVETQPTYVSAVPHGPNHYHRFVTMESAGFTVGNENIACAQGYKFFLATTGHDGTSGGRLGLYIDELAGSNIGINLFYNGANTEERFAWPGGVTFRDDISGTPHCWVLQVEGLGTALATAKAFMDGVCVASITHPWALVGDPTAMLLEQCGANINNGPVSNQYRLWREVSFSLTPPSYLMSQ